MVNRDKTRTSFSLSNYMIAGVIMIIIIFTPILYNTIIKTYQRSSEEQFISHVHETAGLLAEVLTRHHGFTELQSISRTLSTSFLGGKIEFIELMLTPEIVIRPVEQDGRLSELFREDDAVNQHGDQTYYLSIPIHFNDAGQTISILRIGFDESAIIDEHQTIKSHTFQILAVYLLLIILVIFILTKIIHKPLQELREKSLSIVEGYTNIPMLIPSRLKEINLLSDDLEKMRHSLVDMAERMHQKATHDDLTGLPNRYLYIDHLELAIAMCAREHKSFAILLIDLNRFKEINDTLGHSIGDEVLKGVANRMQSSMRESDTLARFGGDEFCILLNGVGLILAETIAKKLINFIEPNLQIGNHSLNVSASIGISIFPNNGSTSDQLIQRADIAMYYAKNNNLNIASYHKDMDSDSYEKLILTNDMRHGINNGDFTCAFQPKIDLSTLKPCGCEFLLRWNHPELGLIEPDKFIPLAERENLIGELTNTVITPYLKDFVPLLKTQKDFHVSINVSPVDLFETSLLSHIEKILTESHFPASQLYIEVTENAIMKNPGRSAALLNEFHKMGIKISIDDFGTGYSSLAYLQKFPISELKIDKSFITYLASDSNNYPIVNAAIAMAHDLGIQVVAEGIETEPVMKLLTILNCDIGQGFHISKPMDFNSLVKWLENYDGLAIGAEEKQLQAHLPPQ